MTRTRSAGLAMAASLVGLVMVLSACGAPRASPSPPQAPLRLQPPDGFPVMPGADPLPVDETGVAGRWESGEAGSAVYGYYLEALPAAGYRELRAAPGGAVAIIRFDDRAGEAWQLDLLAIRGPGDRTEIRLGRPRP